MNLGQPWLCARWPARSTLPRAEWVLNTGRCCTRSDPADRQSRIRKASSQSLLLWLAAVIRLAGAAFVGRFTKTVDGEALVQQLIAEHAEEPRRDEAPHQAAGERCRIARAVRGWVCARFKAEHPLRQDAHDGRRGRCNAGALGRNKAIFRQEQMYCSANEVTRCNSTCLGLHWVRPACLQRLLQKIGRRRTPSIAGRA